MKQELQRAPKEAFTIIELVVVIAVLVLLCCLAVPAMARSKTRSPGVGCLSNMRQMMVGWAMYAEENNGILLPNGTAGQVDQNGSPAGWCPGSESWGSSTYNTNPVPYANSRLGPYISSNVRVLTCPGDVVLSDNGRRIRSYSMNGQMGVSGSPFTSFNPGWSLYVKESDLICPAPKDAFIFCDESPYTLVDGYLQLSLSIPEYPDLPASYLEGGCGFSFADGHGEIHKWRSQFIQRPVIYGATDSYVSSSGLDQDWIWLRAHSACP